MAYIIATDSGCDIAPATLQKWGVISADLTFRFDGEDQEYTNREMSPKDFYDKMRAGGLSRTSAIKPGWLHVQARHVRNLQKHAKKGKRFSIQVRASLESQRSAPII